MKKIICLFSMIFVLTSCSLSTSISVQFLPNNVTPISDETPCNVTDFILHASSTDEDIVYVSISGTTVALPVLPKEDLNKQLKEKIEVFVSSVDMPFSPNTLDFYVSEAFDTKTYTFYVSDSAKASNECRLIFSYDKTTLKSKSVFDFLSEKSFEEFMLDKYGVEGFTPDSIEVLSNGINVYGDGNSYFVSSDFFEIQKQFSVFNPENYSPVLNKSEKYVALTFDDGPNPYSTQGLLQFLDENDVKATFFMVGYNIEEYPTLVKNVYKGGHDIGIHSYKHSNYELMEFDEVVEDIDKCASLIYDILGKKPYLVRPPYGNINIEDIDAPDYFFVNWNVDPCDWKSNSPEQIARDTVKHVKSGSIILLHDIYITSCKAAELIIKELKADGYRFVTISEYFDLNGKKTDNKLHFRLEDYNVE